MTQHTSNGDDQDTKIPPHIGTKGRFGRLYLGTSDVKATEQINSRSIGDLSNQHHGAADF